MSEQIMLDAIVETQSYRFTSVYASAVREVKTPEEDGYCEKIGYEDVVKRIGEPHTEVFYSVYGFLPEDDDGFILEEIVADLTTAVLAEDLALRINKAIDKVVDARAAKKDD